MDASNIADRCINRYLDARSEVIERFIMHMTHYAIYAHRYYGPLEEEYELRGAVLLKSRMVDYERSEVVNVVFVCRRNKNGFPAVLKYFRELKDGDITSHRIA